MIRHQEDVLHQLQSQHPQNSSAIDDSSPSSVANSRSETPVMPSVLSIRTGHPGSLPHQHGASQRNSPSLSAAGEDHASAASFHLPSPVMAIHRDEHAFYQAETQTLTRENQMLRHRIRELERQLTDSTGGHVPARRSSLLHESHVDNDQPMDLE
jgi:hypothetical protein